ncbi:CDC48 family AAA ATPase [Candidatus Woesearchaeota archaeon]|nr:CDC48 family AAA ATPase [Candidatus Woesearchaeota archaeon]
MAEKQDLKLKVAEAIQDDVNKGIVRIDSGFMKDMEMRPGDIIEIEGERLTVGIVDRAYPGDIGLNIIRMDGIIRRNAKTGVGEMVRVAKANIKEAKRIVLAPAKKGILIRASSEIFKQGLLGRAVVKGDIVSLGGTKRRRSAMSHSQFFEDVFGMIDDNLMGFGLGDLKFIVVDCQPKQPVIITELTEVIFNPEAVELPEEKVLEVTYEDIGGLTEEINKLREMVELPLKHPEIFERLGIEPPKGVLLHGPPGSGKTLLAKAVANETNSNFILINGPELMSKYYGQSEANIRKKFEEAEKNAPSIIFIDEIDAIAPKREEVHGEVERRVVAQLLAMMDGLKSRGKVVVIAATNIPNVLDPALRRPGRFDREIEIGVPDKEGRLNILKIHTRNMPIGERNKLFAEKEKEKLLREFSSITHGFVGADLASLTKEAAMVVLRRVLPDMKLEEDEPISKDILEKMIVTRKDLKEALRVVRPSAMREVLVEIPTIKWADIGGLEEVKQELKEAVEWPLKNPDAFRRMGIRPPRGILMYGAPGTGKTLLAKAVANESEANFILVKGPEVLSKWVGESERGIRKIFTKARQVAPCIIFFDEVDAVAPRRGLAADSHVTERVVNQILTEMDGLEEMNDIVVIAATNRPDMLDTALLRPGRFDRIILTPAPILKTREEIFAVHTKSMPLKGVNVHELAEKTEGYAGADIEAVCREAAIIALREDMRAKEVGMKHFEEALKRVPPSITKEIEKMYEEMRDQFRSARAKQMAEEKPAYMG